MATKDSRSYTRVLAILIMTVTLLGSSTPEALFRLVLKNDGIGVDWNLNQAGFGKEEKVCQAEGTASA